RAQLNQNLRNPLAIACLCLRRGLDEFVCHSAHRGNDNRKVKILSCRPNDLNYLHYAGSITHRSAAKFHHAKGSRPFNILLDWRLTDSSSGESRYICSTILGSGHSKVVTVVAFRADVAVHSASYSCSAIQPVRCAFGAGVIEGAEDKLVRCVG